MEVPGPRGGRGIRAFSVARGNCRIWVEALRTKRQQGELRSAGGNSQDPSTRSRFTKIVYRPARIVTDRIPVGRIEGTQVCCQAKDGPSGAARYSFANPRAVGGSARLWEPIEMMARTTAIALGGEAVQ